MQHKEVMAHLLPIDEALAEDEPTSSRPSPLPLCRAYDALRSVIVDFMVQVSAASRLGGRGRIVCLDETHITRKKRSRSGFQGRTTLGHQTILLSGCELDVLTMVGKLQARALLCSSRTRPPKPSRLSLRSTCTKAQWCGQTGTNPMSGWTSVRTTLTSLLSTDEESSLAFDNLVCVSTNAIEGLFSRMKRFLRGYQACPRRTEHYAAHGGIPLEVAVSRERE